MPARSLLEQAISRALPPTPTTTATARGHYVYEANTSTPVEIVLDADHE